MSKNRAKLLRIAVLVCGMAFLLVYPLMIVWPSGWAWKPGQSEYEQMIIGVYATLGVFLLWASREPEAHLSLIWFTVWCQCRSRWNHGCPGDRGSRGTRSSAGDVAALLLPRSC